MKASVISSKPKLRIVLDTNVIISALVFGGNPELVLDMCISGAVDMVVCQELHSELRRKVTSKFPLYSAHLELLENRLQRDGLMVQLGWQTMQVCRDLDDDIFIEMAVAGGCSYIVSGDKDLLVLNEYQGIKIIKPAEFLKL